MKYEVDGLIVTDDRNCSPSKPVVFLERWCAFPPDHITTVLCLRLMKKVISRRVVESMLDVGCGTGILAIAGLKLGIKHAVAVDISRIAVFSARRNMRLNSLEDKLEIRLGSIESVKGSFDLIAANLLLPPLLKLSRGLKDLLSPGGALVLSGIYEDDVPVLEKQYGLKGREVITGNQFIADYGPVTWAAVQFASESIS